MKIVKIIYVFIYSVIVLITHLYAYSILDNPSKYDFLFSGYFYLYMIKIIIPISFFGSFAFFLFYKKYRLLNSYFYTLIIIMSQIVYFIPKMNINENLVNFVTIGLIISVFFSFILNRIAIYYKFQ